MMKTKTLIISISCSFLAGCGGSGSEEVKAAVAPPNLSAPVEESVGIDDAPPPPPSSGALPKGMVAVSVPAAPEPAAVEVDIPAASPAEIETDLQDLNSAVDQYIADQKRAPTVNSLLKTGYIERLPTPPNGKLYVFDKSQNRFVLRDA